MELAVEMTCQKCVRDVEAILSKSQDIEHFEVNLDKQSVLVRSNLQTSHLVDLIEGQAGKRTVIMGVSGTILNFLLGIFGQKVLRLH